MNMPPPVATSVHLLSSWPAIIAGSSVWLVFFGLLQWRVSPSLCRAHFPSYARLSSDALRREWDSRVVSSVHATLAGILWLLCWILKPKGLFEDPGKVGGDSWLTGLAFVVMAGYMIADAFGMLVYMELRDMASYQLHHCVAITGFLACVRHGTLHYFVMYRVASELSTPMVNQLWFFRVSGYRKVAPALNAINSAALTLTFACCRILPIPIYWLRVWSFLVDNRFSYVRNYPCISTCWFAYSVALDCLNFVWFRRLIVGGLKLMRNRRIEGASAGGVVRDTSE